MTRYEARIELLCACVVAMAVSVSETDAVTCLVVPPCRRHLITGRFDLSAGDCSICAIYTTTKSKRHHVPKEPLPRSSCQRTIETLYLSPTSIETQMQ